MCKKSPNISHMVSRSSICSVTVRFCSHALSYSHDTLSGKPSASRRQVQFPFSMFLLIEVARLSGPILAGVSGPEWVRGSTYNNNVSFCISPVLDEGEVFTNDFPRSCRRVWAVYGWVCSDNVRRGADSFAATARFFSGFWSPMQPPIAIATTTMNIREEEAIAKRALV